MLIDRPNSPSVDLEDVFLKDARGNPRKKLGKVEKRRYQEKKPGTHPAASGLGLVADGIGNVMVGHCDVEPVLRKKCEESSQWQPKICADREIVNADDIGDDLPS
jgi:hypothetical protein